jgi:3-oxo-5-alpha-steroid 4-dehydrogenase 1
MVIATGWAVTALHGYFHADYFTRLHVYTPDWLRDPRFIIGFVIYYSCYVLNLQSDAIIRNLRTREEIAAGNREYRVPRGGLFRWITSPSYFTELGAWLGFAICTWSLAGAFIFLVSVGNLVPRAFATQRWYRERFADYPRERKALIPFLL